MFTPRPPSPSRPKDYGSPLSAGSALGLKRSGCHRLLGAGLLLLVLFAYTPPASAYVRTRDRETNAPYFWTDPRQVLEVADAPPESGISTADLMVAARTALANWSRPAISCTGLDLRVARETTDSQVAANDARNRIIMRVGAWCRDPVNLTNCRGDGAVATTTTFTRARPGMPDDGELLAADIEVNAVGDFEWGFIPDGAISGRDYANTYDLTAVLTHEAGHFIGLAHTCMVSGDNLYTDDDGVAYPSCSEVPLDEQASIEDATMYPFTGPGEVKWRTLTNDDARAVCEIYPTWSVPLEQWIGGGGCSQVPSSTPGDAGGAVTAAIFLAALLLISRREPPRPAATPRQQRANHSCEAVNHHLLLARQHRATTNEPQERC